jgi:molybdenum cofactor cytidylyltransferase
LSAVAAILLAAGRSSRFTGGFKLLATHQGRALVRIAAEAALASRASPVIMVTGHRSDEVADAVDGLPVVIVHNPDFASGLSSSLRTGFSSLPAPTEAAVVMLGDMPLVGAGAIDRLISVWEKHGRPAAVVPVVGGRRANPVLLSRILAPDIASLTGDRGAGPLLAGREDVLDLAMDDPGLLADVDTPEMLAALPRSG